MSASGGQAGGSDELGWVPSGAGRELIDSWSRLVSARRVRAPWLCGYVLRVSHRSPGTRRLAQKRPSLRDGRGHTAQTEMLLQSSVCSVSMNALLATACHIIYSSIRDTGNG